MINNNSKPIVIVGAGTVGLMLAHELVTKGKNIIIIEAGNENLGFFKSDEYQSIGKTHAGVQYGRAKAVGGTSNLWGGQLTEFIQEDIEVSNFNQPKWVVDWQTIKQYYSKVYEKLSFSNSVPFAPQTLIKDETTNETLEIFCSRWIKQPNFKFHYWDFLKKSPLVTIHTNATVTDIEFENSKCSKLIFFQNGTTHTLSDFENVVLANGTIEIVRLLLHNATKHKTPYSNNKNIGLYFQDHLGFKVGEVNKASKDFFNKFSNFFVQNEKLQPRLRLKPSNKSINNYLGISGFFSYESNVSEHIYMFKQFAKSILGQSKEKVKFTELVKMFFKLIPATPQIFKLIFNYIKSNKIYVPFNSKVKLIIHTQQISIKKSRIFISENEFDNIGLPKAVIDWQIDGNELSCVKVFCKLLNEYLQQNNYGIFKADDWFVKASENYNTDWIDVTGDQYHQAGGAIMSNSENDGVVNDNLKVHNTDNLFIAGACVMPTSSYGNITLTSLALSLKLADYLTKDN